MSADYDFSELRKLGADLGDVTAVSRDKLRAAVQITSLHVKNSWNQKLAGASGPHTPRISNAVTYDTEILRDRIESEIGAVRGSGRQAGIVRLIENGSVNNGARGYGAAALHENENDFERGISRAIDDSLKQLDL